MLFFLVVALLCLDWPQQAADIAHLKANFARRFSCNRGHAAFPRAISESGDNGDLLPLSLFMQYFGHGTDEQTADDDEVGDLIIWFPLHGRPGRTGLPGRGTMGADGRTEGTSFCQCTYATQLERRETPGEGFNFAITTDKIHFNCATTTFRIIASISQKRPK